MQMVVLTLESVYVLKGLYLLLRLNHFMKGIPNKENPLQKQKIYTKKNIINKPTHKQL